VTRIQFGSSDARTAERPAPIFTINTSNEWHRFAQGCVWGTRRQILHFDLFPKTEILGQFVTALKISAPKGLNNGDVPMFISKLYH